MRVLTRATIGIAVAAFGIACGEKPPESGDGVRTDVGAAALASESKDPGPNGAGPVRRAGADVPRWREVVLPAGTALRVTLDTPVASDTSRVEDPVTAHLTQPIIVEGVTALAEGSRVTGVVTEATRAGKVKGTSRLALRFDSLTPAQADERYDIETATVARQGPSEKKKDALKIAAPAAGGAIVGGIVGGKKGAAIGGAAGGGAGAAVVMTQRGQDVRMGRGAALTLRLAEPLTIRVRI